MRRSFSTRVITVLCGLVFALSTNAQEIKVIDFDALESKWINNNDTLYVVNYWATWCKPCIEELPGFYQLDQEYKDKNFKMILVSLDFPNAVEKSVIPFVKREGIECEVVLLNDDPNVWINKVNVNWNGAIPVTQFFYKGKSLFYKEQLTYEELKEVIEKLNFK